MSTWDIYIKKEWGLEAIQIDKEQKQFSFTDQIINFTVADTLSKMISSILVSVFEAHYFAIDYWLATELVVYPFPGCQVDSAAFSFPYSPLNGRFIACGALFAHKQPYFVLVSSLKLW